ERQLAQGPTHGAIVTYRAIRPRKTRLHGREADALRHAPVFRAVQETSPVGDGLRVGRDVTIVREDRGQARPTVARRMRGSLAHSALFRSPLVAEVRSRVRA